MEYGVKEQTYTSALIGRASGILTQSETQHKRCFTLVFCEAVVSYGRASPLMMKRGSPTA